MDVAWYWLFVAFLAGAYVGYLACALMTTARNN